MKRQRRALERPKLMPEVILLTIVFFIHDEETLDNFFRALSPLYISGSLEHLQRVVSFSKGWPSLALNPTMLDGPIFSSVQEVAKYFSRVHVRNYFDYKWLTTYLKSSIELTWSFEGYFFATDEFWNNWASLNITRLNVFPHRRLIENVIKQIPRLEGLISLSISSGDHLEMILEFAAQSRHLIELELLPEGTFYNLATVAMLKNVIDWFDHQPVRVFAFSKWCFWSWYQELKQTFYQVIFNCPTLERLSICDVNLSDIVGTNLDLSMGHLSLIRCDLDPRFIDFLTCQLKADKVKTMDISQ